MYKGATARAPREILRDPCAANSVFVVWAPLDGYLVCAAALMPSGIRQPSHWVRRVCVFPPTVLAAGHTRDLKGLSATDARSRLDGGGH
jgi:hypothetical protein